MLLAESYRLPYSICDCEAFGWMVSARLDLFLTTTTKYPHWNRILNESLLKESGYLVSTGAQTNPSKNSSTTSSPSPLSESKADRQLIEKLSKGWRLTSSPDLSLTI